MTEERTILKVRGIEHVSSSNLRAFIAAAELLGFEPDWLACVVSFETAGSFSPSQRNLWAEKRAKQKGVPFYGAVGLIQFMPETCAALLHLEKTRANCEAAMRTFESMAFAEQLNRGVVPYFRPYTERIESLEDCYCGVFYPAAIGRPGSYVLGARGAEGFLGRVYEQNDGFDRAGNNDGYVTKDEICQTIRAVRDAAAGRRLVIPADDTAPTQELPGDVDDEVRANAEQVLASVYTTASRMIGELV